MQLIDWDILEDDAADGELEAPGSYTPGVDWVILESDIRQVLALSA